MAECRPRPRTHSGYPVRQRCPPAALTYSSTSVIAAIFARSSCSWIRGLPLAIPLRAGAAIAERPACCSCGRDEPIAEQARRGRRTEAEIARAGRDRVPIDIIDAAALQNAQLGFAQRGYCAAAVAIGAI